jgi:excisionase family DNA binding protein
MTLTLTPRFLRVEDAAQYLATTRWNISEAIRRGAIPFVVQGKHYVLDVKDLDRYAERLKTESPFRPSPRDKHGRFSTKTAKGARKSA